MSSPAGSDHIERRILTCYYRPKPGGFCKRLFRAINALLDRGHTVHYLAVVKFPIDHPHCHFHRFPWPQNHTSGYFFWGFFHLLAPVQLLYLGFRYRINRLFAFGGHNYALFLQPLHVFKKIPLTLFLRGDAVEKHRVNNRSQVLISLEIVLEGFGILGTRMYGVSEALTDKIIARHTILKPSKLGVLRNDIIDQSAKCREKRKNQLPLHLACVGMLEPGKNQRFLLKIMENVREDKAYLYLYGVGPDEDYLRKVVKEKNLMDRVHFMGWVEAEEIWPTVDLLLMPSLHEGAPNAVLEALGYGVPVFASNIPENTEILSEKFLLPLGKGEIWLKSMGNIICNHKIQLQKMIREQEASTQFLRFDWEEKIEECIV